MLRQPIFSHTILWLSAVSLGALSLLPGAANAQQTGDLIKSFNAKDSVVAGEWTRTDDELKVTEGAGSRVVLAQKTPPSYALTVEFTRTAGKKTVGVILPVGSAQCAFLMSTFEGEAHGIGVIDGQIAKANETTIKPGTLETDHPYRLLIEVDVQGDLATIDSTLDGRPFLSWKGNPKSLTMLDFWKLRQTSNLGLCNYAQTTFHSITLRPLDRTMRMTRPQKNTSPQSRNRTVVAYASGHGEPDAGRLTQIVQSRQAALKTVNGPVTASSLEGVSALIIRAPKQKITKAEQAAIQSYIRSGGALLIAMDEERRTGLETTNANELLKPFDLSFTEDTPYLHNCGAISKAGAIHPQDREVPYSGGRAVAGGEPFGYQLDQDGNSAQPFATAKSLEGGGRIIILGDGMALGLMGTPNGIRLSGVPRDPSRTTYWGKDSDVFVTELVSWLLKSR